MSEVEAFASLVKFSHTYPIASFITRSLQLDPAKIVLVPERRREERGERREERGEVKPKEKKALPGKMITILQCL